MRDWMDMTAADLSPYEAWQQYMKATRTPDQASRGAMTYNLYSIFLAGIEYAEAKQ